MNFSEIKELVELFESGSIRELDLKQGDLALYLNKNETNRQVVTQDSQTLPQANRPEPIVSPQVAEIKTEQPIPTQEKAEAIPEGQEINSPIVGVVYTASDPASPNFVSVGDKVSVGDTLCIIEAMKIMNEVKSEVAGVVTEVLIENEDVVEFGQALFRIA